MRILDGHFWNGYFKVYDILNKAMPYQELMKTICAELEVKLGERILDAGSGTGNISLMMTKLGANVLSIDNNEFGLKIHKTKDPAAATLLVDITNKLPFPDEYFEKIVCNNTLYTIDKQKRPHVINEFRRVLKNDGIIVISNIKTGFKPYKILLQHIIKQARRKGIINTSIELFRFVIPTVRMLYYNHLINKSTNNKAVSLFGNGELKLLLEDEGFRCVSNDKIVYAGQAILNTARK